jgi:hypothetical protein
MLSLGSVCYICGYLALKIRCRCLTHKAKQADCLCFRCHVADADNSWLPHLRWITCYVNLIIWMKGKKNNMPPAVTMIRSEPISHLEDCCFCLTKIEGDSKKNKINSVSQRSNCKEPCGTRRTATYC